MIGRWLRPLRLGVLCLCLLFPLLLDPAFAAEVVRLSLSGEAEGGRARLRLASSLPLNYSAEMGRRELVLRFDHPVDVGDADALARTLPGWVAYVGAGYDSLLVRAARDVTFRLNHAGDGALVIAMGPTGAGAAPEDARREETRLELLRARLLAQSGRSRQALERLRRLRVDNPQDAEVLLEMANLMAGFGAWRRAVGLYDDAHPLALFNRGDIDEAKLRLLKDYGPQVRVDVDLQDVKDGDRQLITQARGHMLAGASGTVGFLLENRHLKDDEVRRLSGAVEAFEGSRQRGEIFYAHDHGTGGQSKVTLHGAAGTVGFGLAHERQAPGIQTRLSLDIHKPYWDLVEGLVDEGNLDRLELFHGRNLGPRLSGSLALRLSRYGMSGAEDLARTGGFAAAVRYALPVEALSVSAGYGVEGEYMIDKETRTDGGGNPFEPLPVSTREYHALDVALADELSMKLRYSTYFGYTYDRFGSKGPFAGGELAYEPTDRLEMGLRASLSTVSGRGDDSEFRRGGAYALWRF